MHECANLKEPSKEMIRARFFPFSFTAILVLLLPSCSSVPGGTPEGAGGPGPTPTAGPPQITWSASHNWVTRRYAETVVTIGVGGVSTVAGTHASKAEDLDILTPAEYPSAIPGDAVSAVKTFSSSGPVFYYVQMTGPGKVTVFQYFTNEAAMDKTPEFKPLKVISF